MFYFLINKEIVYHIVIKNFKNLLIILIQIWVKNEKLLKLVLKKILILLINWIVMIIYLIFFLGIIQKFLC